MYKLDILAFGAHPDDVELTCSGTILLHTKAGSKVGIVDLSRGELGTRGNEELRKEEAAKASSILGLTLRENLNLPDGFIRNDRESRMAVVAMIRKCRPEIILCNAINDRHPDHAVAAALVSDSVFLSGLIKVQTEDEKGVRQKAWKPRAVYHYIQDRYIKPDFLIDVSSVWEERMQSVYAFSSQFYNPDSDEPETPISSRDFIDFLNSRAREFGRPAGISYAEGFTVERTPLLKDLFAFQ
jgi:bacillithiol biosynthesis deacetylase BshB1